MFGPLGNTLASQGGVDAFLHGLVNFGRALLGKAPQLCVAARFDSQVNVAPEFVSSLVSTPLFQTNLSVAPIFMSTKSANGEFSSMIQTNPTWPECE